jgi:hypothetical protein
LARRTAGGTILAMRSLGLAFAVLLLWVGGAQARREQTYAYPYFRVWTTAVRMMRVDFESPISEKDRDSGYFLFDYPDSGKPKPGSVEVVRAMENGVETVRVVITVAALPSYVEQMMLDRLTRRLKEDYGDGMSPKELKDATPPPQSPPGSAAEPSKAGASAKPTEPAAKK